MEIGDCSSVEGSWVSNSIDHPRVVRIHMLEMSSVRFNGGVLVSDGSL